jgi:hypothetical protein
MSEQAKAQVKAEKIKNFTSTYGNNYVFQKVKPSKWLEIIDNTGNGVKRIRSLFYPAILENVVVQPSSMNVDDFEEEGRGDYAELEEVIDAALRFQQGE